MSKARRKIMSKLSTGATREIDCDALCDVATRVFNLRDRVHRADPLRLSDMKNDIDLELDGILKQIENAGVPAPVEWRHE